MINEEEELEPVEDHIGLLEHTDNTIDQQEDFHNVLCSCGFVYGKFCQFRFTSINL